jgi:hypothetical protein
MLAGSFHSPIFLGVGLVFGAVGVALLIRRIQSTPCGQRLRRTSKDGSEISFHCAKCDIVWMTGIFQDGG